jgi:hypothetical protein
MNLGGIVLKIIMGAVRNIIFDEKMDNASKVAAVKFILEKYIDKDGGIK